MNLRLSYDFHFENILYCNVIWFYRLLG